MHSYKISQQKHTFSRIFSKPRTLAPLNPIIFEKKKPSMYEIPTSMISDVPLTVGKQQYLCHIRIPNFTEPTLKSLGLPKRMVVKPPQNCDTGAQNQHNQDNRRCSDFYLHQELKNLRSSGSKTKNPPRSCWILMKFQLKGQVVFPVSLNIFPK